MQKYPIGIQSFKEIINGGYVYIDKTQLIHQLISSGKYYFLSRPRRFGKSLLLSTIKEIFSGNNELFKGLWIENQWDWRQKNPVIHLRLSQINYQKLGLYNALSKELDSVANDMGVSLKEVDLKDRFRELIRKAAVTDKVVILIDEYDKPIVDYLDDLPIAEENRSVFKSFYSVLKDADEYIRLLLITGVSRFTKVSIFSDLNNLRDITLSPGYATLTGITQQELETYFSEEISEMQQTDTDIKEKIRKWYNGYSWNGKDKVYNPFSLLNFMANRVFENYWFQTGTPTFLVKLLREQKEFILEPVLANSNFLATFEVSNPLSVPLLFQTGYITIKEYDPESGFYTLGYPNREVEKSLVEALLGSYRNIFPGSTAVVTNNIRKAMLNNDVAQMITSLNDLITGIPYDLWRADHESIFHIIMHMAFKIVALEIESEVHSSQGRCDVLVRTATHIYVMELKLNSTAQKAMKQITEKKYLQRYQGDSRKKVAIGINFSSEKREIEGYLVKEWSKV
jgi:hypothetical protein